MFTVEVATILLCMAISVATPNLYDQPASESVHQMFAGEMDGTFLAGSVAQPTHQP